MAWDRSARNRKVAIKKVIASDVKKKMSFLAEAHVMKTLDHPNICKLLETYEQERSMFLVMEYCEGGEVFDRLTELGYIEESTTADIARQSASALLYAHNQGIAHRDLKPENICFCSPDVANTHVKLIDWGLAHHFRRSRMNGSVGSLGYAAPEVMEAGSYDDDGYTASCDIWSLGVLVYVMLCGKPPFWGSFHEQMGRMKKENPPMKSGSWQQISGEAKHFIKQLLKFDPKKRPRLEEVLRSPWLTMSHPAMDPVAACEVLQHLRDFSNTSRFFSICVASVARQLDHHRLRDVYKVFRDMDTNGDGVLELHELKSGFERFFGKRSEQAREVERLFASLDLDGSGTIDYTEFCAAGIGERMILEEDALWAAFKVFDVQDDDGRLTKDEIKQVLFTGNVNQLWTEEVCEEVADEIFDQFDRNRDGSLDFQDWLALMRECAWRHKNQSKIPGCLQRPDLLAEFDTNLHAGNPKEAYMTFSEMDGIRRRCSSRLPATPSTTSTGSSYDGHVEPHREKNTVAHSFFVPARASLRGILDFLKTLMQWASFCR